MKRTIDFSADLGTPEDPFEITIDSQGIGVETECGRTRMTPEQFEALVAEVRRYERAIQAMASALPTPQAAE